MLGCSWVLTGHEPNPILHYMRLSKLLGYSMLSLGLAIAMHTPANAQSLAPVHPKDQIALQLGAIQMGYTTTGTVFQLVTGNATNAQQAANALVMGRNALDATTAKPAVKVQGAVDSPAVDTVEYRDQLYSAVEHVVTAPVTGTVRGVVTLEGGKKVGTTARLFMPPSVWTIPVPFALESRSSADVQVLRDELVAAGVLSAEGGGSATTGMVTVGGGTLPQSSGLAGQQVSSFQIGKYEVTWGEWKAVRDWALMIGYFDLGDVMTGNRSITGSGENHPVNNVSWYDAVKWCNARSEKEGLNPVYYSGGVIYRVGEGVVDQNEFANGYRLPTEKEWEWAARGGVNGQGYQYSGSNNPNLVAWYWDNSQGSEVSLIQGRGTWPVGQKEGNELAIHDMSGNVWEWCWDAVSTNRRVRGGAYNSVSGVIDLHYRDFSIGKDFRNFNYGFVGFRVARNAL